MIHQKSLMAACFFLACSHAVDAPQRNEASAIAQAVVGGVLSTAADDAAIMLVVGGAPSCTGSLVAPNLVLTALHCVAEEIGTGDCNKVGANMPATSFAVALGVNANPKQTVAKGKQIFRETTTEMCSNDLALILLDKDVPGGKLASVRLTPVVAGEDTFAVGYGEDGKGNAPKGRQRRNGVKILALGPAKFPFKPAKATPLTVDVLAAEILTGESVCFGDSGGPLFDSAGAVVGATSRGIGALGCIDAPAFFSATSGHEALIRKAFDAAGHPLPAGEKPPAKDAGAPAVDAAAPTPPSPPLDASLPPASTPDAQAKPSTPPAAPPSVPADRTNVETMVGDAGATQASTDSASGDVGISCRLAPKGSIPSTAIAALVAFVVAFRRRRAAARKS
jgi:hypothetical protein